MFYIWLAAGILALYLFLRDRSKNKRIYELSDKLPGPSHYPVLGTSLEFITDSTGIFKKMGMFANKYDRYFKIWNNGKLFLIIRDCKDAEVVLGDTVNITKSDLYKFIIPWIGYGLLTSTGNKWKTHRRIITPTFFFKILEDFLEVFNKNSKVMCEMLENEVGKDKFNIFNYVNRAALDNICETAMGVDYNVQRTEDSSYLKAVKTICSVAGLRLFKVWLMPDLLFRLSPYYTAQKEALDFIHNSTSELIKQKRELLRQKKENDSNTAATGDDSFSKKKTAFLDLLLESAGSQLSDQDIQDEVNTFMFEGHDTISSALSFALYEIANNPDVQEKLYAEQMEVLGDPDAPLTMRNINEMRYLECVVKETLRLYPSVPLAGRELEEDIQLPDGPLIPKGTNVFVFFYYLHRDPKIWSNPDKFDPDNFAKMEGRHPYSYVPFSAGSRNCIGQKFALLEMKTTISFVVRQYKLFASNDPNDKLMLANELVLISKNGQNLRIEKR